jgi:VWFA-related protein
MEVFVSKAGLGYSLTGKIEMWAVVVAMAVTALVGICVAQTPGAATPQTQTLNVAVTDKGGNPVTGLTQQDFSLVDNKSNTPITNFKVVVHGQEPVHVILVVDNIVQDVSAGNYVKNELDKYFRAQGGPLPYPTTIAVASQTGTQLAKGFYTDPKLLADVLQQSTIGLRPTNDSAGAQGAAQNLNTELKGYETLLAFSGKLPGRKIIVWFAPGWPQLINTRLKLNELQKKLVFAQEIGFNTLTRDSNVTLYNINPIGAAANQNLAEFYRSYLGDGKHLYEVEAGDLNVAVQATHSGGLVLNQSTELGPELSQVYRDVNSWYEVTFTLPAGNGPDEYHHLEVKVDKGGLKARAQDVYYVRQSQPAEHPMAQIGPH